MTSVIISKKIVILYWNRSIDDLKFKMKKITVELKKLLFEEGINRKKKIKKKKKQFPPPPPPCISRVQEFNCDSKCVQSVFKCALKCVRVFKSV